MTANTGKERWAHMCTPHQIKPKKSHMPMYDTVITVMSRVMLVLRALMKKSVCRGRQATGAAKACCCMSTNKPHPVATRGTAALFCDDTALWTPQPSCNEQFASAQGPHPACAL